MCVGEYTNYPEELMLFNFLFKVYASFCVRNLIVFYLEKVTLALPFPVKY
jgi:hypothetical protein